MKVSIKVAYKAMRAALVKAASRAPSRTERIMAGIVADWHRESVLHAPVRATRTKADVRAGRRKGVPQVGKYGRGFLRKQMRPVVARRGDRITGAVANLAPYAWWLYTGTRHIAKGRVLAWNERRVPVRSWAAKALGGSPRGEMPIIIPYRRKAAQALTKGLEELADEL